MSHLYREVDVEQLEELALGFGHHLARQQPEQVAEVVPAPAQHGDSTGTARTQHGHEATDREGMVRKTKWQSFKNNDYGGTKLLPHTLNLEGTPTHPHAQHHLFAQTSLLEGEGEGEEGGEGDSGGQGEEREREGGHACMREGGGDGGNGTGNRVTHPYPA